MLTLAHPYVIAGSGPESRSKSPAPGAYDAQEKETLSARSAKTFNTSASTGKASFGTFTKRDEKRGSVGADVMYSVDNPGVNSGKAENLASKAKRSFNREVSAGRSSFNSSSNREKSSKKETTRGGPGEHDYSHLYQCGNSTPMTSSFMSAQPLGGHIRKSDTPGVGSYSPATNSLEIKSASRNGGAGFAGTTSREKKTNVSATGEHVGPGSYELQAGSIEKRLAAKINPRSPGFGSSSARDKED